MQPFRQPVPAVFGDGVDRSRALAHHLPLGPRQPAPGWRHLLELIDEAAAAEREEFRPLTELSPQERRQTITLPPSIAQLTAVRRLVLYGSNLVRIPPEIGAMTSLEEFTPTPPTGCTGSPTSSPDAGN